MEKIKVFEAFSGIGTQRMALKRLGIPHESVGVAEIDKHALKSYEAIHGDLPNYGDISQVKVSDLPDMDLFTYSFPCQDISLSGNTRGLSEGSGTRSSLLWECRRVIEGKKPKYLLLENVKNLVGRKFKPDFDRWLAWLETQGYTNYWEVLNAKDYGIPQNRERVFVVSILGEHTPFVFPSKREPTTSLRDLLEEGDLEEWYLSEEMQERFKYNLEDDFVTGKLPKGETYTVLGSTQPSRAKGTNSGAWVYSKDTKIMSCLSARDYKQPKMILEDSEGFIFKSNTKKGYDIARVGDGFNFSYPASKTRRGRVSRQSVPTLQTGGSGIGAVMDDLRIRKLTPLEYWRLMGISDNDFYKAVGAGVSNSQLYRQAGNAIVVDVLTAIFSNMFTN